MICLNPLYKKSVSRQALVNTNRQPKWTIHHLRKKDGSVKPLIFIQVVR